MAYETAKRQFVFIEEARKTILENICKIDHAAACVVSLFLISRKMKERCPIRLTLLYCVQYLKKGKILSKPISTNYLCRDYKPPHPSSGF